MLFHTQEDIDEFRTSFWCLMNIIKRNVYCKSTHGEKGNEILKMDTSELHKRA
jgi:hypothetical protein